MAYVDLKARLLECQVGQRVRGAIMATLDLSLVNMELASGMVIPSAPTIRSDAGSIQRLEECSSQKMESS